MNVSLFNNGFDTEKKQSIEQLQATLLAEINNAPLLENLSIEQLEQIAKIVIIDRYKEDLDKRAKLALYSYEELKEKFLNAYKSFYTQRTYKRGLELFENWCSSNRSINKLDIKQSEVDTYIQFLKDGKLSNNSIAIAVKAISAFYSFAERFTNGIIKNTVKGTRATPKAKANNNNKFYTYGVDKNVIANTEKDIETIINQIDNVELKAIIQIAVSTGLRVGSFQSMEIHSNKYRCISKEHTLQGVLADNIIDFMKCNGITGNKPFTRYTDMRLSALFKYHTKRLYKKGLIRFEYSFHDLRHLFALKEYSVNKDIYRLKELLGHNSIVITERYLKGLNIIK